MIQDPKLLAFDTATQTLGVALYFHGQTYLVKDEGGAKASETLLQSIATLLQEHQIQLVDLDALVFGAGPGAFTGLRTAAATAQGLALGANLPVIPVITLLAGAQEYLLNHAQALLTQNHIDILVQLDARMDEWYWAHYQWDKTEKQWLTLAPPSLSKPEDLQAYIDRATPAVCMTMTDTQMHGMVELAKQAWLRQETVTPEQALPLYIRDKVALTTAERMALHAEKIKNQSLL